MKRSEIQGNLFHIRTRVPALWACTQATSDMFVIYARLNNMEGLTMMLVLYGL